MSDPIYAIRRADGEPVYDEYAFLIVGGPDDWGPASELAEDGFSAVEYEMLRMSIEVIDRRTLPHCSQCDAPAEFWGLCEPHAREDDPEYFEVK